MKSKRMFHIGTFIGSGPRAGTSVAKRDGRRKPEGQQIVGRTTLLEQMMNFLKHMWIRFLLRCNDVCPEHGPMATDGIGGVYCERCTHLRQLKHERYITRLLTELRR